MRTEKGEIRFFCEKARPYDGPATCTIHRMRSATKSRSKLEQSKKGGILMLKLRSEKAAGAACGRNRNIKLRQGDLLSA